MQENCYKLAAIKACSDNFANIGMLHGMIMMTGEQAQWAVDQIGKYYEYFRKMMLKWKEYDNQKTKNAKTSAGLKNLVLTIVKKNSLCSQELLLKESGLSKGSQYYSIVQTLETEGRIRKITDMEVRSIPMQDRTKYGIGDYKGQIPTVFKFVKD